MDKLDIRKTVDGKEFRLLQLDSNYIIRYQKNGHDCLKGYESAEMSLDVFHMMVGEEIGYSRACEPDYVPRNDHEANGLTAWLEDQQKQQEDLRAIADDDCWLFAGYGAHAEMEIKDTW